MTDRMPNLNPDEECEYKIMEIIHEFAANNQIMDLARIINVCFKVLEYRKDTIVSALNRLIKKKKIIIGKRIIKDLALDNDSRKKIYLFIKANPGVRLSDISEKCDISISTLKPHLKILLEYECIQEFIFNSLKLFAIYNLDETIVLKCFILRDPEFRAIIAILQGEGFTISEIKQKSEKEYNKVYARIQYLMKLGCIYSDLKLDKQIYCVKPAFLIE